MHNIITTSHEQKINHTLMVHSKIVQINWKMFNMSSNVFGTYYNSYFNI